MKSTRFALIFAMTAISTFAIYGCEDSGSHETTPCDNMCTEEEICNPETNLCEPKSAEPTPECTKDADCKGGKVCKSGKCEADDKPECESNAECPDGKVCKSGKCEADDKPECESNEDCFDGKICQKGQCDYECYKDTDCDDYKICSDHQCTYECQFDYDCTDGKICDEGRCALECTDDFDCTDGKVCTDGVCKFECVEDYDCDDDMVCRDNVCKVECIEETEDVDCPDGMICKDYHCVNECTSDDDCENPLKCKENRCTPECTQHEDCPDDMNCVQQQCRTGCEVNEDCREGACLDGACVPCRKNADCGEGRYCQYNNCIDCAEDEHCEGIQVCKNNKCVPPCSDNSDCSGDTPVCSEKGCVQCLDSKDCSGNELCMDNVCKLECTEDYDCSGEQKCNLADNHCYECLENADCLGGKRCIANKCEAALANDWDADGVADDQDRCPYNPNVTTQEDADCNYVTDPDGTRVFEVWHASDFTRLRKDLPTFTFIIIAYVNCENTSSDNCCNVEGQAPWSNSCVDENTVKYCDGYHYIRTGGCEFGCANGNCRSCRPANTPTQSGDCCNSSYPNQCKDDTYFMECKDGKLNIRACGGGCVSNECRYCREPESGAAPQPNDCCDASTFVETCSTDKKSTLHCVDGRVKADTCTGGECRSFEEGVNFCVAKPDYSFHVRLMHDINLADVKEVTDKPFDPVQAPYKKTITNDDNTSTEVLMVPGESDYEPFQITDAPCVMSWDPVELYKTEFDGKSHRIFVKNSDNQTCSLESSFFKEIRNSTLKDISFYYNNR